MIPELPIQEVFQEDSRNDGIFEFCIENQVPWQNLSRKNTLYVENGQTTPNPGDSRIPGCLDSRVQKSKDAPKSGPNHYNYSTRVFSTLFYQKLPFCRVAYFLYKTRRWEKTMSRNELILTWQFFLAQHESCFFSKILKQKYCLIFNSMHFRICSAPSCEIWKKPPLLSFQFFSCFVSFGQRF